MSGFLEGSGAPSSLLLSDTFVLPDSYLGVPVDLTMGVSAYADCREGTGNCSTVADSFDTGHLGITGSYTSTHSYQGLPQAQVPEPVMLSLFALGLSALAGRSHRSRSRRRQGQRCSPATSAAGGPLQPERHHWNSTISSGSPRPRT